MHLKGLASRASGRIKCSKAGYGLPCKLGQPVIIIGIDNSELSAGKGYPPGAGKTEFAIRAGIEMPAGSVEPDYPPPANVACLLFTAEHRAVCTHHPDRKKTIVATNMIRIAYVVMRIAYCRFYHVIPSKNPTTETTKKSSPSILCTNLRLSCENGGFFWVRKSITAGGIRR